MWEERPGTDWLAPKWEYQAVYEWTQTFAPGETIVEISYRPLYGSDYGPEPYYPGGAKSAQYYYDSATKEKLAAEGSLPTPFTKASQACCGAPPLSIASGCRLNLHVTTAVISG